MGAIGAMATIETGAAEEAGATVETGATGRGGAVSPVRLGTSPGAPSRGPFRPIVGCRQRIVIRGEGCPDHSRAGSRADCVLGRETGQGPESNGQPR